MHYINKSNAIRLSKIFISTVKLINCIFCVKFPHFSLKFSPVCVKVSSYALIFLFSDNFPCITFIFLVSYIDLCIFGLLLQKRSNGINTSIYACCEA